MNDNINKNGMAARLLKVQKEMENEKSCSLKNSAGACICGCFNKCFCVSETEFAVILDYIMRNESKEEVLRIISKAKSDWEFVKKNEEELADTLEGIITLEELLMTHKTKLPFSCLFYNKEDRSCSVYEVRPLFCRAFESGGFCEKTEEAADLNSPKSAYRPLYYENILPFLFLRNARSGFVIIRRPAALFYFFSLIFKNSDLHEVPEIEFCRDLLYLGEQEYLNKLLDSCGGY